MEERYARGDDPEISGTGAHESSFPGGWTLSVVPRANGTITADLRRDDTEYSLVSADPGLIAMIAAGYDVDLSFDNVDRPTVVWRPTPGASPFVWFCGIGVAGWSSPL